MVNEKKHKEGFKSYNCSITLGTVRRNQTEGHYEDVIYVDLIVD